MVSKQMLLPVLLCLLAACGSAGESTDTPPAAPTELTCNGSAALCDRRYNEVTYLVTHNGMSNADDPWIAPNQNHPLRRQLADGVRGLSLDMHENPQSDTDILTCHGTCLAGSRLLKMQFDDVRTFLEENPGAVLTILYETVSATDAQVGHVIRETGLDRYVYTQATDATWPTLGEMVKANKRLVFFTQNDVRVKGLIMPMFKYMWDNPYEAVNTSEFSCEVGRGDATRPMLSLNHFITAPLGGEYWAKKSNTYAVLQEHVERCHAKTKMWPTFLWIDWYATGDALPYVKDLNSMSR